MFGERKCSPNGSYEENGSGKFNDITERYLAHLRDDLGIDIVWYTGVIDHATQTSFPHKGGDYSQLIKGKIDCHAIFKPSIFGEIKLSLVGYEDSNTGAVSLMYCDLLSLKGKTESADEDL